MNYTVMKQICIILHTIFYNVTSVSNTNHSKHISPQVLNPK